MPRYPQGILVACPSPWDEQFELVEELLREEVRRVLAAGFVHCYVFGTGGEGYAVDTRRFRQVVDVFHEETAGKDVSAMVGVIGLSTPQIVERHRVRPRRRLPDVPDLTAVVGPRQRRRAAAVLRGHVRALPGLALPPLQPAANEARPRRPGLRSDHRGGPEPRCDEDHRRRHGGGRGAHPSRGRAAALHGRGQLSARRDVRRVLAPGVLRGAVAADDATRCSRRAGREMQAS